MLFSRALISLAASLVVARPHKQSTEQHGDVVYNVYHHAATRSKLSFVKNSGICETTPGVNQYSGYLSVGEDANMFFWFFESRNNPKTAPLVSWFGGGPGSSSQFGMFTQHGPCEILENSTEPTLREHSLNSFANVLYIDQPIGTGFSYGDGGAVNSTKACSPYVWNFLQLWFGAFPEYKNRQLSVFSGSYGGHTGTDIVNYILDKNQEIKTGDTSGDVIEIVALGVINGWFDAKIQEKANIDYAFENPYRPLIDQSLYEKLMVEYNTYIVPGIDTCEKTGTTEDCDAAYRAYVVGIEQPIQASTLRAYDDFFMADIQAGGALPPTGHVKYLQRADVRDAVGAMVNYRDTGNPMAVLRSGDDAKSFLPELSRIVQDGVQVLIVAGDSDYVCNWVGNKRVADAVEWSQQMTFSNQKLQPYTVNGKEKGSFKSMGNLHFVRVFDAGHNVWWYQPETSLQITAQLLSKDGIFST
ncbi:putative carboxypeptidase S1 [Fusarium tricinctum]|uniref:Carboxypeptidase S1 n=1 Tax=Fusarium tricinctum TaxID=61284 RepID=A0A8K0S5G3_9HYPO|nr:putative carboxypeptidase S1 [Fusarium tricinctum]